MPSQFGKARTSAKERTSLGNSSGLAERSEVPAGEAKRLWERSALAGAAGLARLLPLQELAEERIALIR